MAIRQARLEMIRSLTVHCPLSACWVSVTVTGHHCLHVLVQETGVCQGRCNSLASHVCSNRAGPNTPLLWYAIPSHGVGVGFLTQPNHDHTSLPKPLPRLPTSPTHSHTRPHLPTTTPNYSHTQPGPHTGIVPPPCQRFLKPAAPQIIKPTMTHYPTYSVSVHYFRYVLSNGAAGCPIHQGHLQVLAILSTCRTLAGHLLCHSHSTDKHPLAASARGSHVFSNTLASSRTRPRYRQPLVLVGAYRGRMY